MPIYNRDIAGIFTRIADLLDIEGANQFRVRAYRNAARTVSGLSRNVADMVEKGEDLSQLSGIGKDLAGKIEEIVKTGTVKQLKELEGRIPGELTELLKLSELGPKRVKALYKELEITTLSGLEEAARTGKIRELEGFGKKTEENILEELERWKKGGGEKRIKWVEAEEYTLPLFHHLREVKGVKSAEIAGSFRRKKETVGDIDILVSCENAGQVMERFVNYEDVDRVISKGETRSSVVLRTGLQVDLRAVPEESYGAALHYFTGSKAHNIAVRKLGVERDLKINEYGVFKGEKRIAGKSEQEVFQRVALPYIEPELREDRGEIQAAQKGRLPGLIELKDIRGDLQSHTKDSDGKFTMEEMANAAREKGYEYLAITDHSKRVSVANGLDEKRLAEQLKLVEKLNTNFKHFQILKSIEVDILVDGTLDLSDAILKELDLVVCSVHYNTRLSREKQTDRVLRAMDNPHFHIFGHPTGRLIGERDPYEIDLERVMEAAKERGCHLELNAQPDRLDLSDGYCKMAKEMGIKIAISTDAHTVSDLGSMRFGVAQARRGWLEPDDVLNTRSWSELRKLIRKK